MKIASLSTTQKIVAAAVLVITVIAIIIFEQAASPSVARNAIQAPEFNKGKSNSSEPTSISATHSISTPTVNMAMSGSKVAPETNMQAL